VPTDDVHPDLKDWTWVLERPCPQCGYDASLVPGSQVAQTLLALVPRWRGALARPNARVRPRPEVWSTVEYAAHVRDLCQVFDERVRLMLTLDDPQFENWDQDASAVAAGYADQSPERVSEELAAAASAFAMHLQSVGDDDWEWPGRRSNGSTFTIDSLSRYFMHDVVHHLHDVGA
jgi:hypothetical protein